MKVTQWSADVPYKNLHEVTAVNGGLNAIGNPLLIKDNQWSEHVGFDINKDGTISQREIKWEEIATQSVVSDYSPNEALFEPMLVTGISYTRLAHHLSTTRWYAFDSGGTEYALSYGSSGLAYLHSNIIRLSTPLAVSIACAYQNSISGFVLGLVDMALPTAVTEVIPVVWQGKRQIKLVSHANRIFSIGGNVLSWSSSGQWNSWYGSIPGGGYVASDNGYWTFEKESYLYDLVSFNDSLYVFGEKNVYVFRGYSADTFSSDVVLMGVGIRHSGVVDVRGNYIYYYVDGIVWEYDGGVDSHPISYGNMVEGGIPKRDIIGRVDPESEGTIIGISCDRNRLILQYIDISNSVDYSTFSTPYGMYEYEFNFITRTWSRHGSTNHLIIKGDYGELYHASVVELSITGTPAQYVYKVKVWESVGYANDLENGHGVDKCYLVSKAFYSGPSTKSALNAIWIQYKCCDTINKNDIKIYMSRKAYGDSDWELIHSMEDVIGTGDIETVRIQIPKLANPKSECYRIKIETIANGIVIFPYTREIRSNMRS